MELGLKGKKILITGASQGIGEGLAQAFAAEGCELKIVARNAERLHDIALQMHDVYGISVQTLAIDLCAPKAIEEVARFADDIDVLVNNAGSIPGGNLWEVDEASWRQGWELKVFGYINLTRLVYGAMKTRGGGVILNNIGNGGENFDFDYIAGTTGNAALMAFTRALGGKSLNDGIRVVGVNPGPVDTDRINKVLKARAQTQFNDAARYTDLLENYPMGRAATVAEIADLMVFLASARSAYTSGAIFTVDAGLTSKRSIS
jgi:NAD(P)-dependent dehydrogenase (short-subunit alcohol dehydrogenase family)